MVGVPIGTEDDAKEFSMKVATEGGTDKLARMPPLMPDRQVANLSTSLSLSNDPYTSRVG